MDDLDRDPRRKDTEDVNDEAPQDVKNILKTCINFERCKEYTEKLGIKSRDSL